VKKTKSKKPAIAYQLNLIDDKNMINAIANIKKRLDDLEHRDRSQQDSWRGLQATVNDLPTRFRHDHEQEMGRIKEELSHILGRLHTVENRPTTVAEAISSKLWVDAIKPWFTSTQAEALLDAYMSAIHQSPKTAREFEAAQKLVQKTRAELIARMTTAVEVKP